MKMRLKWFVVPAFALGLGACKKEDPATKGGNASADTPGVVEKAVEKVKDAVAEVTKPSASAEERGAKLGFAKHLPRNTEGLISVHNATKTGDKVKALKFWKLVEDEMGTAAVEGADEAAAIGAAEGGATEAPAGDIKAVPVEEPAGFQHQDLWGSEVTIAIGDTAGEQFGNLFHLYSRFGYFQMRQMTKTLISQLKTGNGDEPPPFDEQMFVDMINDPEAGISSIEKLSFPPVYIGAKVDPAKIAEAAEQIGGSLGIIGSLGEVEPVEVERAGAKFSGYKLSGEKIAEMMAGAREEMAKNLDADVIDRLFASIAKKDIVLLSGVVGDYIVIFMGGSVDQLQLAADVNESLAANKDLLGFTDDYLKKDIMAYTFGEKESLETLMKSAGSLGDTFKGIRDGLAGEDGLGETREIESLLQIVIEREEAVRKFMTFADSGSVAFYEEGLKIESFGGADQGMIDWKTTNTLSYLGESSDVVFFANATVDAGYNKASSEFVESLAETAYAISRKVAGMPDDNPALAQFKEMSNVFDEKFRGDFVGLWQALNSDLSDGLGRESAVVIDLKGAVPAIPGIPQGVVDQGKFPRISVIAPVVDRSKIAASWDKLNQGATDVLAKISEISGKEIPMQKPISSEKNDLVTWFFPMPFFTDDFVPSITLDDKWFVASTSKLHAQDLVATASKGNEGSKGLAMKLNLAAVQKYAEETLKVIDGNAEAIFGEDLESYQSEKERITKVIDALGDYDSLSVYSNRDKDVLRTSIHFKTR
jgi:hypothetical protein